MTDEETKNLPPLDMSEPPKFTSWRDKAFALARELNELEEAVSWYVAHVEECEGTDFLTPSHVGDANVESPHAKRLRRYRKDFDGNRDDN